MTVHECFSLCTARVKALGELKEERKKKKTKMTKLDFHRFQVRHFSNDFKQSPCYGKMAQCQRADLSVFERIKLITRRNNYQRLNTNTLYVDAILFFRASLHRQAVLCLPNSS